MILIMFRKKKKANIGQITSSIVCEPIVAPVFQDDVLVGEEGYFILPSSYPDNAPRDCLESLDISYFTDLQKDNWKIALKKSESIPFTIYKKDEICTNASKNIQVSVAYMSYLVNKKSDLIKGAMFYHAGVGDFSYEEILNRNVKKASDASYIYNILQYATFQNGVVEYTILLKSGEKITYRIHNMLEVEKDYEEKNGYHL